MRRSIIISLLVSLGLNPLLAVRADDLQIQESAPDRYVVVKGDTLWDISGRFLKQPWRWPEIWGLNKEEIKDPHWIYPGNVIVLDRSHTPPRLHLETQGAPGEGGSALGSSAGSASGQEARVRLSPEAQSTAHINAIPSIPLRDIAAFMRHPMVVDVGALSQAPKVVAFDGRRTLASGGDQMFVQGELPAGAKTFQVYRPGPPLLDPDTHQILAYRADYVSDARLTEAGDTSRFVVLTGGREVAVGDRLLLPEVSNTLGFVPSAPAQAVEGKIINMADDQTLAARHDVVVVSLGSDSGLQAGNILAVYPAHDEVVLHQAASPLKLPETRSGLLFVFRTFERVSYALVVQSQRPLNVLDAVRNP